MMMATSRPPCYAMGTNDQQYRHNVEEKEVDLDADTKESPEELFFDEETAESPHKITLWYSSDMPRKLSDKFPIDIIQRAVGQEVLLGRHRAADVLLYDEHMARQFATVTCRTNTSRHVCFVLRNVCNGSKLKRIVVTDVHGRSTELLPTQEVELSEKTKFRLEGVEFQIGIELGDVNSKSFEFQVKRKASGDSMLTSGIGTAELARSSIVYQRNQPPSHMDTTHVGLPVTAQQNVNMLDQRHMTQSYQLMANHHQTAQAPLHTNIYPGQQESYGYVDQPPTLFSQPSAIHDMRFHHQEPTSHHPQLLERGSGYPQLYPEQLCLHHGQGQPSSNGFSMVPLQQTLPKLQPMLPQSGHPPRGIVTNPSSRDKSPGFYPSPANQRFRFPQSPPDSPAPLSPDLSDLPRGPPLAGLGSYPSVDLHPGIPSNVVTTHPVTETGQPRDNSPKVKDPVEHEDKPK